MAEAVKLLVTTGGGGRIARVNVLEVVPAALVALMVVANVPLAVGVPEISPVEPLTFKPFGSPVAPYPVGLLVATIW